MNATRTYRPMHSFLSDGESARSNKAVQFVTELLDTGQGKAKHKIKEHVATQ